MNNHFVSPENSDELKGRGARADQRMSGHEHISKLEADKAVGDAIMLINSGNYDQAEIVLAGILKEHPKMYQALVARGTCRALAGQKSKWQLAKAETDFSSAIKVMPELADVWKRRSQARMALGNMSGATRDLQDCLNMCVVTGLPVPPPLPCLLFLTPLPCLPFLTSTPSMLHVAHYQEAQVQCSAMMHIG